MSDRMQALTEFIAQARWFGGKGRAFQVCDVQRLGTLEGDEGSPVVTVDVATVRYGDGAEGQPETERYHVPLAHYHYRVERLEHALIGSWHDEELGEHWVYDAVHDRDAMNHYLRVFAEAEGDRVAHLRGNVEFHRLVGHTLDTSVHSTLFSGEQSNSSVMFGEDSLLKIFRKVTPGINPDVAIHEVLTRRQSDHVAALYGWIEAKDPQSSSSADDHDTLQLAMLQQFLRTASDGWDLALASVRNLFAEADLHADEVGGDFAGEAGRLGIALAEVHATLAEQFGVQRYGATELADLSQTLHRHLDEALEIVPELAEYAAGLRSLYDAVAHLDGVEIQRIHGDLHLGQTLRTVYGWKLVDFEGEPAKTLAERVLPDSGWRDVAGMIRSFDYAPRVVSMTLAGTAGSRDDGAGQRGYRAKEWAARNRAAFLGAYSATKLERDPSLDELALLRAYVADKAVYEAVYETRNRPTWVTIPLSAIAEIVTGEGGI